MKRLTTNRNWEEAKNDLVNELGYSHIWKRLNEIENILGDEYEFETLKRYIEIVGIDWNDFPEDEEYEWEF